MFHISKFSSGFPLADAFGASDFGVVNTTMTSAPFCAISKSIAIKKIIVISGSQIYATILDNLPA